LNNRKQSVSYKAIVDTMVTAVVVLDQDLHIEYLNSAAEDLIQVSASQATGKPLVGLVIIDPRVLTALQQVSAHAQPFTERDTLIRLPDNISRNVDFTVNIFETQKHKPKLLLELQPLSRLKQINKDDESVARQETARQLIRGLAHEVKNPLGGIRGAAQLLEQELESEELEEYTGVIISEVDRLSELVDRMLGPQRQLSFRPINLLKVTEHVITLIEAEYPGRIEWRRDYDPSLPDIEGDESQLIQAVLNVVRNACEALEDTDAPRIQLRSRGIRRYTIGQMVHRLVMQLDITDNGPGIDQALQQRIFFPMISGRADGSGLGLAIAQNVVTQHHGLIQVSSRPGQTCFSIFLPLEIMQKSENLPT
jgi:two-component system nitrogen regulation sensor histidine kinase GlnL